MEEVTGKMTILVIINSLYGHEVEYLERKPQKNTFFVMILLMLDARALWRCSFVEKFRPPNTAKPKIHREFFGWQQQQVFFERSN